MAKLTEVMTGRPQRVDDAGLKDVINRLIPGDDAVASNARIETFLFLRGVINAVADVQRQPLSPAALAQTAWASVRDSVERRAPLKAKPIRDALRELFERYLGQ